MKAANRGDSHSGNEVRVLTVRFFDSAPARIACDVDDRREHVMHAARARLARCHREHLLDQRGIERRGQCDGLREARPARGDETVKGLFVQEGRDA